MMKTSWTKHKSLILLLRQGYLNCVRLLRLSASQIQLNNKRFITTSIVRMSFIGVVFAVGYQVACWQLPSSRASSPIYFLSNELPNEQDWQHISQQLGRIEANLLRINALGEKVVQSAKLDPQEFDFSHEVAMGGPETLIDTLREWEIVLERRYAQFNTINLLTTHTFNQDEFLFSDRGRAVTQGWISSFYGQRHDPFTGRKAWHSGVDIAGKEGTEIKALASGIVSYANVKGGYGRLVEIKHANGLSSRYGHAKEILVKPGQLVRKGETIALLGSTGRSTAPHLHLEIRKDGQPLDPGTYFPDLRRS